MRLSELQGRTVLDASGVEVGQVHDVRLHREALGELGERLRVAGVITGLGAIGTRLGYAHGETRGPWILSAFVRHLARNARFVPAEHIIDWHADPIHIDVESHQLSSEEVLG